jgi:hypothetical protein
MPIKVDNRSSKTLKTVEEQVQQVVDCIPVEHLRGFSKIVLVDRIDSPFLEKEQLAGLPALYHPRVPGSPQAFGEIALDVILPTKPLHKKFIARAQLKAVIAQLVLSLVAQHYYLTVSSQKKKAATAERAVQSYVEKYFTVWRGKQTGWRVRLFKPLMPYLERWQKSLARRYKQEQKKKAAAGK